MEYVLFVIALVVVSVPLWRMVDTQRDLLVSLKRFHNTYMRHQQREED